MADIIRTCMNLYELEEHHAGQQKSKQSHSGRPQGTLAIPEYREIVNYWHPTKNAPRQPSDFTQGSSARVWLQCKGCPHCGLAHEWHPIVSNLTKQPQQVNCPQCHPYGGASCPCGSVASVYRQDPFPASCAPCHSILVLHR